MKKIIFAIVAIALIASAIFAFAIFAFATVRIEPITETYYDGDVAIFVDESGTEWAYTDYYADPADEFELLIFNCGTADLHDDIILEIFAH